MFDIDQLLHAAEVANEANRPKETIEALIKAVAILTKNVENSLSAIRDLKDEIRGNE